MLADAREQHIAAALRAARPLPRGGWEERAMAALADIRPRRHPDLLTYVIVAALILLLAASVFAAVRHFLYVEGTLRFHDVRWAGDTVPEGGTSAHFLSGELEWSTDPRPSQAGDISAVSGKVVHWRDYDAWPPTRSDILVSNPDWSDGVNLTEIAKLGGVNCKPKWSPDGTMIAFQHAEPLDGLTPCETFHVWVMNADGTDAHPIIPEGSVPTRLSGWSPHGSHLDLITGTPGNEGAIAVDLSGREVESGPAPGPWDPWVKGPCCPEDLPMYFLDERRGQVDGRAGQWHGLIVEDADGSNRRVVFQQFVADADIERHYPTDEQREMHPDLGFDWVANVHYVIGPHDLCWSPNRDKIAFLAALPFDPDGPFYKDQVEVWVYDFAADELIRITNDDVGQQSLSWNLRWK